jgi:hypothetical protein
MTRRRKKVSSSRAHPVPPRGEAAALRRDLLAGQLGLFRQVPIGIEVGDRQLLLLASPRLHLPERNGSQRTEPHDRLLQRRKQPTCGLCELGGHRAIAKQSARHDGDAFAAARGEAANVVRVAGDDPVS